MPDNSAKPETTKTWNIPSKEHSGDVSIYERVQAKFFLGNAPIWTARKTEPREKELLDLTGEVYKELNIREPSSPLNYEAEKAPRVVIFDSKRPEISIGAHSGYHGGSILISTAVVDALNRDQLKAVIAKTLSGRKFQALDAFVDVTAWFAPQMVPKEIWEKMSPSVANVREKSWIARAAMDAVPGAIVSVAQWFGKRKRVYRDDQLGAQVAGTQAMVTALDTLHEKAEEEAKGNFRFSDMVPQFIKGPSFEARIKHLQAHETGTFTQKYEAEAAKPAAEAAR